MVLFIKESKRQDKQNQKQSLLTPKTHYLKKHLEEKSK